MSTVSSEAFDSILRDIKPLGTFHKKWFLMVILPYFCIYSFVLNYLFLVATPKHWCHVPGRNETNYTVEQWKAATIPLETTKDGEERYSQCSAYSVNKSSVLDKTECIYGYEYDKSVYSETAVSYYDWTCDNKGTSSLFFTLTFSGMVVGSLIFGPLSDYFGRKPIFMFTVALLVVFGTASLLATNGTVFLTLWFFRAIVHPASFTTLFRYCLEFLLPEYREVMSLIANCTWVVGTALLAIIAWSFDGYWFYTGLATTLPFLYFLLFVIKMPESPRWLASKNRIDEARDIIAKMAKDNKVILPENLEEKLRPNEQSDTTNRDIFKFLILPRQLLRMLICTLCLGSNIITYYVIHLNLNNISGNIYLEFFIITVIEVPGYFLGLFAMRWGRRFPAAGAFLCNGLLCFLSAAIPAGTTWPLVALSMILKLEVSAIFTILLVHIPEMFPTAFRSIGSTLPNTLSRLLNLSSPQIAALGSSYKALPFIVLGVLSLVSAPSYLFLPETKNRSLPQTIEEAEGLGKGQKFWGLNISINITEDKKQEKQ